MKTLRALGFDAISAVLGGRCPLIKDEEHPTWFRQDMTVSEHRPVHGRAGKIYYVWGPALGLQKLDLATARTFIDTLSEFVRKQDHSELQRVPTHIACHEWDTNAGLPFNHCFVHRFPHEYDSHFRKLAE